MSKFIDFFMIACLLGISAGIGGCISSSTSDGSESSDDSSGTTQYLVIPGAQFFSGTPSTANSGQASAPKVTAPLNGTTYLVDTTYTWTVEWTAEIEAAFEVTDIIIEAPELGGYFDYILSDEEKTNLRAEIDSWITLEKPSTTQVCNRDYRGNGVCYEQADTGVTEMDFTTANIGTDQIGTDLIELEISFEAEFEVEVVTIEEYTDNSDDDDSDGGSSSSDASCSAWVAMCSCNIRACSDGVNAWYDVGSGVYYCTSISNCTSAAQSATSYCTQGC